MTAVAIPSEERCKELIAKLRALDESLGDAEDCATSRALERYDQLKMQIPRVVGSLLNLPGQLTKLEAQLADVQQSRQKLVEAEAHLQKQLHEIPDPWTKDAEGMRRLRPTAEADEQRRHAIEAALRAIKIGTHYLFDVAFQPPLLVPFVGPTWVGTLGAHDERIAELSKRIAEARATLSRHLAEAERLTASMKKEATA
jgi:chromosome segregation ATPase